MSQPLPHRIVARAREIIEDERHWTQGAYARFENGEQAEPQDPLAHRFCAIGAIMRATFELTNDINEAIQLIDMVCPRPRASDVGPVRAVEIINDGHQGHAAILALFDDCLAEPSAQYPTLAEWRASIRFHVGQRVECVSDTFSNREDWRRAVQTFPKLHSMYTIRSIGRDGDLIGLRFCEMTNPPAQFAAGLLEPAFNSENFRPLAKANIDMFKKLLAATDLIDAH